MSVKVIGAGLAGCEAAWQLANQDIDVELYEMKPKRYSPAHSSSGLAELVCSNSLKSMNPASAGGILKAEMRLLGSLLLECAQECSVPAGGALAVNRDIFSELVTKKISSHPKITLIREEIIQIPDGNVVIATGPLTSDAFAQQVASLCGDMLSFYDAAAPIVTAESINMDIAFAASRYGKGDADYLNCPMGREEYERFHTELVEAQTAPLHSFEKEQLKVYEGCMPVETLAKRGVDSIRFGPLKPVGLTDPRTGKRPYAVVQLRKENSEGSIYNLVGFQTNLKFGEQKRVFSLIPGLENADFARYGVMHRNTFINSPKLLTKHFALKSNPSIFFAGQLTGVEGYMESAASGIVAGMNMARQLKGKEPISFPNFTMIGALSAYISDEAVVNFQPMGANMGILPALANPVRDKRLRYEQLSMRSIKAIHDIIKMIKD